MTKVKNQEKQSKEAIIAVDQNKTSRKKQPKKSSQENIEKPATCSGKVTVTLRESNQEEKIVVDSGITLEEFFYSYRPRPFDNPIVAAKINYIKHDLWTPISEDCLIDPIDLTQFSGIKIYERSLVLLLLRAVQDLYSNRQLEVSYSISRGLYCELHNEEPLRLDMVKKIEGYMCKLVVRGEEFFRQEVTSRQAEKIFQEKQMPDKVKFFKHWRDKKIMIYQSGEAVSTFYGSIVPRTSYLKQFELVYYPPGVILRYPHKSSPGRLAPFNEQSRLFRVFQEHKKWAKILEVNYIGDFNEVIENGKGSELIKVAEAIQEKKVAHIADLISQNRQNIRLILIAGPSSSGKTTFAKRLSVHLKVNGISTVPISMDDYFKSRAKMNKDENGQYDFEGLDAVDVPLLNDHLNALFDGHQVLIPRYDFSTGDRKDEGHSLQLKPNELVILEGIHGLNDKLTPSVLELQKFKIYVSALTVLNIDRHNRIPTTDLRIIRRIVRDNLYRSYSALDTIQRWPAVRHGEDLYIFPFQHQADVMFNSALIYELAVLKRYAEPLLQAIVPNTHEYSEGQRLLRFLSYFQDLAPDEVPPTSILREFIGESSFKY